MIRALAARLGLGDNTRHTRSSARLTEHNEPVGCREPVSGAAMPTVSRFFGIVVFMNYNDHNPPHFHARYQDEGVLVHIHTGAVTGEMSRRALLMLSKWRRQHVGELLANWDRTRLRLPLMPIPPLTQE